MSVENFVYTGQHKNVISFPLGGIGTGSLGLSGNGRLIDWEIFNRPNKNSFNGFSFFSIKAEHDHKIIDARILHGELPPHYIGCQDMGTGPARETMAGFPAFKDVAFKGEYPLAELEFLDASFPGKVTMNAFNPFIPSNDKDSSIPSAFFEFTLENTTAKELTYTLCFSCNNPYTKNDSANNYMQKDDQHFIQLGSHGVDASSTDYGNLCVGTLGDQVAYQEYWYRGSWFDSLGIFWREFTQPGDLKNRSYDDSSDREKHDRANGDTGSLTNKVTLAPFKTGTIRFVLSWYQPNYEKYWNHFSLQKKDASHQIPHWKNYYATLFEDSIEVSKYCLDHWQRLYTDTKLFKDTLFDSSLPQVALDAISANISILKTPTCLRLENGEFYGWEGIWEKRGSCEGSCTHVWNYAYALPFLFPSLERSMRELDYRYNMGDDGDMMFRLQLPLGHSRDDFRACADGQFGGIIKVYREWKISGDDDWLASIWPQAKKTLDFAWSPHNKDQWDPDKTGVLWGRQHHTLDMELFGPNSWLTGFYLAALKAASEIESYLGNKVASKEYFDLFEKGRAWVDEHLFNGEYYYHQIDLKDESILDIYHRQEKDVNAHNHPRSVYNSYWSDEHQELKYQIGEGSSIDQVISGWHANLCGLGDIFDKSQTQKALQALYQYNFKNQMGSHYNPCRLYSLYDEKGIVICDWPESAYKPIVPVPYSEETMNGFEYQSAIHMIQEGMVKEGMEIITAIRERYDGYKRNPWNEFECGNNYARSMASYGLLLAFSGFSYHMAYQRLGFNPIMTDDTFKSFWSIDGGWGQFEVTPKAIYLTLLFGQLTLQELTLPFIDSMTNVAITNVATPPTLSDDPTEVQGSFEKGILKFSQPLHLTSPQQLIISLK